MAINVDISTSVYDEAIDDGILEIKNDFALVGFNILENDPGEIGNGVEFYFYLSDNEEKVYLLKTVFAFNDESKDTDIAFLNSPLHNSINLNKLAQDDPDKLSGLLIEIAEDRQYYSSFKATDIDENNRVTCIGVHKDIEEKQHKILFNVPFEIYSRIQILKNQMLYNIPINIFIDQDTAFEHVILHKNCSINYLGCDTSYSKNILAFYSLKYNDNKIGLISPLHALDRIITSNILTKEQFQELYKNFFIVNMTKIFIIDWIENDKEVKKVCIYLRDEHEVNIYMDSTLATDCILMKPYDMVYNKQ